MTRAQRLSASQRWASCSFCLVRRHRQIVLNAFRHHRGGHPAPPAHSAALSVCSTPFGITEVGIAEAGDHVRERVRVLNAFRHHRGRHLRWRSEPGATTTGAQRLSASQRSAYSIPPFDLPHEFSAQRLSASQRSASSGNPALQHVEYRVLNAFRHHRGRHSISISCRTRSMQVLNAFRHHRGGHHTDMLRCAAVASAQRLSASQRWA